MRIFDARFAKPHQWTTEQHVVACAVLGLAIVLLGSSYLRVSDDVARRVASDEAATSEALATARTTNRDAIAAESTFQSASALQQRSDETPRLNAFGPDIRSSLVRSANRRQLTRESADFAFASLQRARRAEREDVQRARDEGSTRHRRTLMIIGALGAVLLALNWIRFSPARSPGVSANR